MAANYWVSLRDTRRFVVFLMAIVAIGVFWTLLPAEVRRLALGRYGGRRFDLARYMFIAWIGGWFTILFVRAEDRNMLAPIDYQGLCKVVGCLMVLCAIVIAEVYVYGLFLYKNA